MLLRYTALQLIPLITKSELTTQFTDLSSRIALAGLSPDQPLRHLLEGTLTPSAEQIPVEESPNVP